MIKNMMVPGHVEAFLLIINCSNLSVYEIPVRKLKPLLNLMEKLFKGRTHYTLFVNASWVLRGIFRII